MPQLLAAGLAILLGGQPTLPARDGSWQPEPPDPSQPRNALGPQARLRLTAQPLYASLRVQLAGRAALPLHPKRGVGVGVGAELELARGLSLRALGTYSLHDLPAEYQRDNDDQLQLSASNGLLHIGYTALGIGYAMDIGPVRPTLALGAGPTFAAHPDGVRDGQLGQACVDRTTCDFGLACDVQANVCQRGMVATVYGELGVEVKLTRLMSVGGAIRYFAFVSAPDVYPIYLQAALSLGLRL